MPVFRQPEHAKDVVRCCRNHTEEYSGENNNKKTLKTAPQLTTQNKRYNISSLRKLLTWRDATTGFTEK